MVAERMTFFKASEGSKNEKSIEGTTYDDAPYIVCRLQSFLADSDTIVAGIAILSRP